KVEQQALALMDHPNIAKVLDGGLHENRPFLVMEWVKGLPINEYCDKYKLSLRARLELFLQACHAIQHAHHKGIIHRDIKPKNILVAHYDDQPVVKVIDFGVAKATGTTVTENFLLSGKWGVVGTPQYMSPEQASFNNPDIDTRTDVYSLGIVLYKLLIGTPPFTAQELDGKSLIEIMGLVRSGEIARPSQKLRTSDSLAAICENRRITPKKLNRELRNDLDCLVMKALKKDRTQRYETPTSFAAEVQRYLNNEVLQTHPPSRSYRTQKFVRRNKGQVLAASLVLMALLGGVLGTTLGLVEARRQTRIAQMHEAEAKKQETRAILHAEFAEAETKSKQQALVDEAKHRLVAESEKKHAHEEKQIAQAVKDFLQHKLLAQASTAFQADAMLKSGGSTGETKINPTVLELLDRAAKALAPDQIEKTFPNQPRVQAEILLTVGDAYRGIGEVAKSVEFLQRAVTLYRQDAGADPEQALLMMNTLAMAYLDAGLS
ncbi:MAG: protein kinase domain-containing protein, partial [Gemmataceae bacterium]